MTTTTPTSISSQDEKFLQCAYDQALKSPVLMRHGAVIVTNGKIMGRGFNNYRTYSSDQFITNVCTCHAEIAAIRSVYNSLTIYKSRLKNQKQDHQDQMKILKKFLENQQYM